MIGKKLIHLTTVDSTNNYVAKLFKNGEITSGTVIMADKQTSGRGQRGNIWQSEAYANLMLSFPLEVSKLPVKNFYAINHTVSLAVYDFIKLYCPETFIKWPNDTYVKTKKIAGILIENQLDSTGFKSSTIGIGININQTDFKNLNATSLYLETNQFHKPVDLIHTLIATLNKRFERLKTEGEETVKQDFDEQLWLKNTPHRFSDHTQEFEGKIIETTVDGSLIIATLDGERIFRNGELVYL